MNKLLSANFARLRKDKMFWAFMIFMLLFGLYRSCSTVYNYMQFNVMQSLDSLFFNYTVPIGILTAAFSCLFIGTEYRDGGLRNKLIVGHTRHNIYMANFIVASVASMLMCLAYIVPVCAVGIPVLGFFESSMSVIGMILLGSLLMICAFCSLMTWLSMMIVSKSVVIGMLSVIAFLVLSGIMDSRLAAPEFIPGVIITNNLGNVTTELTENHQYLKGIKREVYQFIHDLLPTGQAIQYVQLSVKHIWQMPLYALMISVMSTAAGVFAFRKKDVK